MDLRKAIQELMEKDGRERTINDVQVKLASAYRINAKHDAIKSALNALCRRKVIVMRQSPGGNNYIGIYKALVKQEAGQ